MKGLTKIAVLGTAAALLGGCGGHNDLRLPSLYEGNWTGNWTSAEAADGGALTLKIGQDGSFTGTMARKGGLSGAVTGLVNDTGHFQAISAFPTTGNFAMDGAMTTSSTGLNGNYTYKWEGTTYNATFTATTGATGTTG